MKKRSHKINAINDADLQIHKHFPVDYADGNKGKDIQLNFPLVFVHAL